MSTGRAEEKRKRSLELIEENKKLRQSLSSSSDIMADQVNRSTSTTHPEVENSHIITKEAKGIIDKLQISSIDNAIAMSMAKVRTKAVATANALTNAMPWARPRPVPGSWPWRRPRSSHDRDTLDA